VPNILLDLQRAVNELHRQPLDRYANPEDQPHDVSLAFNKAWSKPGPYVTPLNPEQEAKFRQWAAQNPKAAGVGDELGPAPNFAPLPMADYDVQGHWLAAQGGDPRATLVVSPWDGKLHGNDAWKTPYDGTFSRESIYALPTAPYWSKDQLRTNAGRLIADETPKKGSK